MNHQNLLPHLEGKILYLNQTGQKIFGVPDLPAKKSFLRPFKKFPPDVKSQGIFSYSGWSCYNPGELHIETRKPHPNMVEQ